MLDETIPWNDVATVVQYGASPNPVEVQTMILYQGTLREVVSKLRASPPKRLLSIRISLPDRGVRPFHYDGHALQALLDKVPPPML